MKKKLQICWNLPVSFAKSSLGASHIDCNFNYHDFARINNCWENLKGFQVISLFHTDFRLFKLRLFVCMENGNFLSLWKEKSLNLMTTEGQSSNITLPVFLKITQNAMTSGMPASSRLASCFPFCLLSFAMNRMIMGNMGKQFIVMKFKDSMTTLNSEDASLLSAFFSYISLFWSD